MGRRHNAMNGVKEILQCDLRHLADVPEDGLFCGFSDIFVGLDPEPHPGLTAMSLSPEGVWQSDYAHESDGSAQRFLVYVPS